MDTTLLGQTAARCMESMERDHPDGSVDIVMIIVCGTNGEASYTRTFSSHVKFWEKMGILYAGISCVEEGEVSQWGEDQGGD